MERYLTEGIGKTKYMIRYLKKYTFNFSSVFISSIHVHISCACSKVVIAFLEAGDTDMCTVNTVRCIGVPQDEDHSQMYKLHGWIMREMLNAPMMAIVHCDIKDAFVTVANCIKYDKEKDDIQQELLHYDTAYIQL